MTQNPCYINGVDCPDRAKGCAVKCKKWAKYVPKRKADREREYEARQIGQAADSFIIQSQLKRNKKR